MQVLTLYNSYNNGYNNGNVRSIAHHFTYVSSMDWTPLTLEFISDRTLNELTSQ